MDLTMLRQMSRRARLDALLHDGGGSKELADILEPVDASIKGVPTLLKPTEVAMVLSKAPHLNEMEYGALLHYLQVSGQPYKAHYAFPHHPNDLILPPQAECPLQIHHGEYTFSCQRSHKGNSAIQFYNPLTQTNDTGFIQTIWRLPLEASLRTFVVVCPHQPLSALEEGLAPFTQYSGFITQIVDALPSDKLVIIEPMHIITHLTTFERQAGTYGINRNTLVVCWALNRGRK